MAAIRIAKYRQKRVRHTASVMNAVQSAKDPLVHHSAKVMTAESGAALILNQYARRILRWIPCWDAHLGDLTAQVSEQSRPLLIRLFYVILSVLITRFF